jgi:hypothetical protein
MTDISEEKLDAIVASAELARHKPSRAQEAVGLMRARAQARHQAYTERAFAALLENHASDFEKACAKTRSEVHNFIERLKTNQGDAHARKILHAAAEQRRKLTEDIESASGSLNHGKPRSVESPAFNFNFVVLDTAVIRESPGISVQSQNTEAWNNHVLFSEGWTQSAPYGEEYIDFYFYWDNPRTDTVIINIESYATCDGSVFAYVDGGFNASFLENAWVGVTLQIFEDWYFPPGSPPQQVSQVQPVAEVSADVEGFFQPPALAYAEVSNSYDVQYRGLVIPSGGLAVFRVRLVIDHAIYGGDGDAYGGVQGLNFAGSFYVSCPALVIAILN